MFFSWSSLVGHVHVGTRKATHNFSKNKNMNKLNNGIRLLLKSNRKLVHTSAEKRAPYPPFTRETAIQKVQAAEDAWNTKDAAKVCLAYTIDTKWRNRDVFIEGRDAIRDFLRNKWEKEQEYKLKKHYFCHSENQIAVTFQYEYKNREDGKYYRAYGNEHWTFDENGLMKIRNASINDMEIQSNERRIGIGDGSWCSDGVQR
mmetsp:Transcript_42775/g.70604  ORF Transcript_42775/g.70604 Transcript_42775/m.70604 type:complete len:202 (-) Transcript_42775:110-715(-)